MSHADKRILGIDIGLFDPRVEDATFSSTRTVLEHEIVIWRVEHLLAPYSKGEDYLENPCLTDGASSQFRRDLARRNREFEEFLQLGRLLVVVVPQPTDFHIATGERRNDGTKAKPRMRRIVEPRQIGEVIPVAPKLHPASGSRVQVVGDPAFAAFWRSVGDQFEYRAFVEVDSGRPPLKVKGTDRVVASAVAVSAGTVLLLPHLLVQEPEAQQEDHESEDQYWERWESENEEIQRRNDGALIDAVLEYVSETQGSSEEQLPPWTERLILPREISAVRSSEKAAEVSERTLKKLDEARLEVLRIRSPKKLVTLTGKDLERCVAEAFEELGCSVEFGLPDRTDRVVRWKDKVAVLEVKGTSKSASEAHATQLEKWVTEYSLEEGARPKGILVVNAWRGVSLDKRTEDVYPAQMVPYAEGREHCLVSTSQLMTALVTATSKAKREAFLGALFSGVGVLDGWDWSEELEFVAEDREA